MSQPSLTVAPDTIEETPADESEPTEEQTKVKVEFDFNDEHCRYDYDEITDELPEPVKTAIAELLKVEERDQASNYDWGLVADALERDAANTEDDTLAEALEAAVERIRDEMHSPDCDCGTSEFDYYTEWIEEVLDEYGKDSPRVYFAAYSEEDPGPSDTPEVAGSSLSFAELRDKFAGRGYDALKFTFDRATGIGSIAFGDRGYGREHAIYAVQTIRADLAEVFLDLGGHYAEDYMLAQIAELTHVSEALVSAARIISEAEVTAVVPPTPNGYGDPTPTRVQDLHPTDAWSAFKAAGLFSLTDDDLSAVARLAEGWTQPLGTLIDVIRATAA